MYHVSSQKSLRRMACPLRQGRMISRAQTASDIPTSHQKKLLHDGCVMSDHRYEAWPR